MDKDKLKERIAIELTQYYNIDYEESLSVLYSNPFLDNIIDVIIKSKRLDSLLNIDKQSFWIQVGILMLGFQLIKLIEKILNEC